MGYQQPYHVDQQQSWQPSKERFSFLTENRSNTQTEERTDQYQIGVVGDQSYNRRGPANHHQFDKESEERQTEQLQPAPLSAKRICPLGHRQRRCFGRNHVMFSIQMGLVQRKTPVL